MTPDPDKDAALLEAIKVMQSQRRGLLNLIKRAGKTGLRVEELFQTIYGWDEDGGPNSGFSVLRARISYLNSKVLRLIGWEISNTETNVKNGRYFLRHVSQPILAQERVREGVKLSPIRLAIFDAIKAQPGISCRELSLIVYGRATYHSMMAARTNVCHLRRVLKPTGFSVVGREGVGYYLVGSRHETGSQSAGGARHQADGAEAIEHCGDGGG